MGATGFHLRSDLATCKPDWIIPRDDGTDNSKWCIASDSL